MKFYKNKWFRYGLLFCLFLGTFIQYQVRAPQRNFSDFHVPYWIGHRLLAGDDIYSYETGMSYFKYTPFYANLTVNFAVFSQHTAANIWYILNFFFFMLLMHLSVKIINRNGKKFDPFLLYVFTVWVMFRFMLQNMHEGQANVFMLALFTLGIYFYTQGKKVAAAFFMAFSIMTKYMTVMFLPYFFCLGQFALLGYIAAFIVLFYMFPALGFGVERNFMLIKQQLGFLFESSMDGVSVTTHANQSLWALMGRLFWDSSVYDINILHLEKGTYFAIVLILMAVMYWLVVHPVFRKRLKLGEEQKKWLLTLDLGMVFICVALFNPNGWMNFFVSLLFPVMVVLFYLIKVKGKDALIMTLFILHFALNSWASEATVEWFAGDNFEIYSSVTFGTLVLFATLVILKRRLLSGTLKV